MSDIRISENTIHLSGSLTKEHVKPVWQKLTNAIEEIDQDNILISLEHVKGIDSAGVAMLDELKSESVKHIEIVDIAPSIRESLEAFTTIRAKGKTTTEKTHFFEFLGEKLLNLGDKIVKLLYLTADIFYWSIVGLVKRKGQRKGATIQQGVLIGVDALQIVALISFLIGFILALQSAAQLRQFGANIYIADLIGIAMLREMGPIMTAIILAGRSGSAIASEIATMVVTEEIDALKTMALNPIRFVVVPKFHAITLTMPLLTIMADLIGIFGGFIIGITYLQLSPAAFINELMTVLILKDLVTGLIKSVVFAWIIVIVGTYFGMHVTGGAEGVGKATTASVVVSIFLVIVADSILGLIFYFGQPI